MHRVFRWIVLAFLFVIGAIAALWAIGAVHFDFPWQSMRVTSSIVLALIFAAALIVVRGAWRKLGALFGTVLAWWLTLKPSNEGNWQPDVAQLARAEIHGDVVTLHNVRNFDYRTEHDFTPRWETRSVRLSKITGIDLALNYWGSPWMAHPILSFQFADAPPVCFSIETRKKVGQSYSAIGGLYRQFSLIFIISDERDVIRVRTNYRKGEDIYLYRTSISPARARERFSEYLYSVNAIHDSPRWYNAITTNCTTSIRHQHPSGERMPFDWRILLNGKGDELMYERRIIETAGLPFPELKQRALINPAANAAGDASDFSARIRAGRPGF